MIRRGEHPMQDEGNDGLNKFLGLTGEGHRGRLIAINHAQTEAIIQALTGPSINPQDGIELDHFYLVRETHPDQWPRTIQAFTGLTDVDVYIATRAGWIHLEARP